MNAPQTPIEHGFVVDVAQALPVLLVEREALFRSVAEPKSCLFWIELERMPVWRDGSIVGEVSGIVPGIKWRTGEHAMAIAVRDGRPYVLSKGHWKETKWLPVRAIAKAMRARGGM